MGGKRRRLAAMALAVTALLTGSRLWREDASPADVQQQVALPSRLVALTFDDGPKRATTEKLLDGLSQRGVQATFFLIGKQIEGNEDLVRRMEAEGHQVGVHTYDHVTLTGLSRTDFDAQVGKTRGILTQVLGHNGFMLRPPYGRVDDSVRKWAESPIILWSVDPEDWHKRDVQREVTHITTQVKDGDIILMHDIFPESVEAALRVVDQLRRDGYAFVTVEGLLAARGVRPENGESVRCAYPE